MESSLQPIVIQKITTVGFCNLIVKSVFVLNQGISSHERNLLRDITKLVRELEFPHLFH